VKIGIIAPEGTAVFNLNESVASANAAVDALNARGGLAGHKVELDYCNDKGDPNQTATCARQMVSDKVLAVVGGGVLNPTVIPPILAKADIPWIGDDAQSSVEFNSSNMFLFSGGAASGYALMAARDGKAGIPTTVLVADVPSGKTLGEGLNQTATTAGKGFIATVNVPPTAADFSPIVAAAKLGTAKAAMLVVGATQTAQFIQAAIASGASTTYEWASEPQEDIIKALGSSAKFEYASPFPVLTKSSDNAWVQRYLSELDARAKTGDNDAKNAEEHPASTGIQSWLAIQAIEVLVKSGALTDLTSSSLLTALKSAQNLDLGGVIPPWTPDKAGPTGLSRVSNPYYYIDSYVGGNVTQLTPKAITAQDIISGAAPAPAL
jgi:ABC-type branched-subunit amino acid transport system substrate-binding protein